MFGMRSLQSSFAVIFTLFLTVCVLAQETCADRTRYIIEIVNGLCTDGERNHVCYGNLQVLALPQPGVTGLDFQKPGDQARVDLVKSLQLSPLDWNQGSWGIARMRVTPTTARSVDDDVIMLLFGDVKVEDHSEPRTT